MMGIIWAELFPTKLSFTIFICYMSLFICQGILVTASQEANNSYKYNTVTVVFLTECLKLFISLILYCRTDTLLSLLKAVKKNSLVVILYFVPAILYSLYNNLAFINLSKFDPTTYYLLLQLRVLVTGILFQVIFKKYLSHRQWLSLALLTIGCMLKQINFGDMNTTISTDNAKSLTTMETTNKQLMETNEKLGINGKNMSGFDLSFSAVFILAQTICSCLAGVYNEYLLKDKGSEVNILIQNCIMHFDSIMCNAVILFIQGNLIDAFSIESIKSMWRFNVIIIIINNAAIGIVTSFFLKFMNSILKTFASALELMFTAILSYFLFSIPIYINTVLAIGVVSFAIYLYSQSPVVNLGKIRTTTTDTRKLLDDTDSNIEEV